MDQEVVKLRDDALKVLIQGFPNLQSLVLGGSDFPQSENRQPIWDAPRQKTWESTVEESV